MTVLARPSDIWQPIGRRGTGYCNFYCTWRGPIHSDSHRGVFHEALCLHAPTETCFRFPPVSHRSIPVLTPELTCGALSNVTK
jgi:hypothetical protein